MAVRLEINPFGTSAPASLTVLEDVLYFSADDEIHGRELWRYPAAEIVSVIPAPVLPRATVTLSPPFPNPTSGRTHLAFVLSQAEEIEVVLYDLLGRRLGLVHKATFEAATTETLTIDLSPYPAGLYLLQITGKTTNVSYQVIHTR